MKDQIAQALSTAFELIESDKLLEAQAVLKPILTAAKDDPDVWWVYAHAVDDIDTARMALENVIRIDASYPNAQTLLEQLEEQSRLIEPLKLNTMPEPAFLPAFPGESTLRTEAGDKIRRIQASAEAKSDEDFTLDDDPDLDDEGLDGDAKVPQREGRDLRLLLLGLIGLALVVGIVVLAIVTSQRPTEQPPSMTQMSASELTPFATFLPPDMLTPTFADLVIPTDSLSVESTLDLFAAADSSASISPTDESVELATPTLESEQSDSDADMTAWVTALSAFTLPVDAVRTEATVLGDTLLVDVCSDTGLSLRTTLSSVMSIIARQATALGTATNAIGTRIIDCQANLPLRLIVVTLEEAQRYARGALSQRDFEALWKSL
jgi:hypothetical protein